MILLTTDKCLPPGVEMVKWDLLEKAIRANQCFFPIPSTYVFGVPYPLSGSFLKHYETLEHPCSVKVGF